MVRCRGGNHYVTLSWWKLLWYVVVVETTMLRCRGGNHYGTLSWRKPPWYVVMVESTMVRCWMYRKLKQFIVRHIL